MAQQVTVKSGDTLSQIAKTYGVQVSDISGYKSGNANLIYPGENLTISNVGNSIAANDIQPKANVSLPSQSSNGTSSLISSSNSSSSSSSGGVNSVVDKYRKQLDTMINNQKTEVDKKLAEAKVKEQATLDSMKTLTTPFREDLENTQRESLYINENFEANQSLINELDSLLTQGNDLITQQQSVTGLASVRNPRIQQTMNDVAARTGVIEAVINARNGQIAVAENLIDRSVQAIAADRQDELSYYQTVLELNNRDILSLDSESKSLASAKMSLIENDLNRAQETADYVKKLMVDPSTASLMGEAGVSLNDSIENINSKLTKAQTNRDIVEFSNEMSLKGGVAVVNPSSVPAKQLVTYTDANGNKHYYKIPESEATKTALNEANAKQEAAFNSAIDTGIKQLKDGEDWGIVWRRIYSQFAGQIPIDALSSLIDSGLGGSWDPVSNETTGWATGGAYETYATKTANKSSGQTINIVNPGN